MLIKQIQQPIDIQNLSNSASQPGVLYQESIAALLQTIWLKAKAYLQSVMGNIQASQPIQVVQQIQELPIEQLQEKVIDTKSEKAAIKIQKCWRGYLRRIEAATKIQSCWRGHVARKAVGQEKKHVLSYPIFEQAKHVVDTPSRMYELPRASDGNTPVFLSNELPVVFKMSGFPENQKRFEQMKQAREICQQHGYTGLVIPRARVYKECIIEDKLPIIEHGTKEVIGFYIENQACFTKAIEEFTDFCCRANLFDITVSGNAALYGSMSRAPVGRYDNIALYLEGGCGKIGLVDLEHFSLKDSVEEADCYSVCKNAICLFPYHFNEIFNTVKKYDSNIEDHRERLESLRDEALKRFKVVYEDHIKVIKKHKITPKHPTELVKITPARERVLMQAMVDQMFKMNAGPPNGQEDEGSYGFSRFKNSLGIHPARKIEFFKKTCPEILNLAMRWLSTRLSNNIVAQKNVKTIHQLAAGRSLLFSGYSDDLLCSIVSKLKMINTKKNYVFDKADIARYLLDTIFMELVKGGEIAYYNSDNGYGNARYCIFV